MFSELKALVQAQFNRMLSEGNLFYITIDKDQIWQVYLNGFGDPLVKQEHNCNCCKSFIRQFSSIVAIKDNKVVTMWDIEAPEKFKNSVDNLRRYIASLPITGIYLNTFAKIGTNKEIPCI